METDEVRRKLHDEKPQEQFAFEILFSQKHGNE